MNHAEKTDYHSESTKYLVDHQIREKLQKAIAELVLHQPQDPLNFLIKHFEKRKKFLVFSVLSILDHERVKLVDDLAHQYNLKVIRVDLKLLEKAEEGDHNDYQPLLNSFSTFESKFDGIILDNFPSNKV